VKGEQVFGFVGGFGVGFDTEDHILGLAGETTLFSDRLKIRPVYVTGGEPGSSFGIWSSGGNSEGDVLGLEVSGQLIEEKLNATAEVDFSSYDADNKDEFSEESDKAYKLALDGYAGRFSYNAIYEYMGPEYQVIGNQGLQKDREGLTLRTGADFQEHTVNISFSRYNDNVEDDDIFAQTTTHQGMVEYSYRGIQKLPVGVSYQKAILDSSDEPEFSFPVRIDTDTVTGRINFMSGPWNLGVQGSYSKQDDREAGGNDTKTKTVTLNTSYFSEYISISPNFNYNRSEYLSTGTKTDTYTLTLDIRGGFLNNKISYEVAGTYNDTKSNDGFTRMDSYNSNFRVSYLIGDKMWEFLNPTVALRGQYNKMNDRVWDRSSEDLVILLALSTTMPFSF
jgi:hypothetical protein